VRGCLSVLILAAVFVVGAAWFGGPALAGWLVGAALAGSGFEGRNTTIEVAADPPIEVLGGSADRVNIGADDATFGDLQAERVDVSLFDVNLVSRTFATIEGELTDVVLDTGEGGRARASRIDLLGEREAVRATVHLSRDTVSDLVATAIRRQLGFPLGAVSLEAPDRLVFTAGPVRITGRFLIESDGGLWLALDSPANPRLELLPAADPLVFREITIGDDVEIVGTVDLSTALD
jgi:hypothetical protein